MRNFFNLVAIFEDLRKLGIGLMLVGLIGIVIRDDISAISGGVLVAFGAMIWSLCIIKWT